MGRGCSLFAELRGRLLTPSTSALWLSPQLLCLSVFVAHTGPPPGPALGWLGAWCRAAISRVASQSCHWCVFLIQTQWTGCPSCIGNLVRLIMRHKGLFGAGILSLAFIFVTLSTS